MLNKDSFSVLFRQSKLASFHPNIPQLYFNNSFSIEKCNPHLTFGLKRPIPRLNTTDFISLRSLTGPFGVVEHSIRTKEYEAFSLLRKIASHRGIEVIKEHHSKRKTHNPTENDEFKGYDGLFFPSSSKSSEPFTVQGKILKKLKDGGFLVNIQDCWVGLLSSQQVKGIDTRFLTDSGSWIEFNVKSLSWIPKLQMAKIYLSLISTKETSDKEQTNQQKGV